MSLKNIPKLFSLVIVIIFHPNVYAQVTAKLKWVVLKDGAIRIDGSTNVNKFSCSVNGYTSRDTLVCFKNNNKNNAAVLSGKLSLPVASFDCMIEMMTKDLRKTLKAKEFPTLNINFISLERYPELKPWQETITGIVAIELAGTSKKFDINYKLSMDGQKIIHMEGTQSIRFSDFNLKPPSKLGGMIRADDKLYVTFQVNFKMI